MRDLPRRRLRPTLHSTSGGTSSPAAARVDDARLHRRGARAKAYFRLIRPPITAFDLQRNGSAPHVDGPACSGSCVVGHAASRWLVAVWTWTGGSRGSRTALQSFKIALVEEEGFSTSARRASRDLDVFDAELRASRFAAARSAAHGGSRHGAEGRQGHGRRLARLVLVRSRAWVPPAPCRRPSSTNTARSRSRSRSTTAAGCPIRWEACLPPFIVLVVGPATASARLTIIKALVKHWDRRTSL